MRHIAGTHHTAGQTSTCGACGIELQLLLLTPCAHLLCPECVSPRTAGCLVPGCGRRFELGRGNSSKYEGHNGIDDFVWLQPGFDLRWREAMQEEEAGAVVRVGQSMHAVRL